MVHLPAFTYTSLLQLPLIRMGRPSPPYGAVESQLYVNAIGFSQFPQMPLQHRHLHKKLFALQYNMI